MKKFRLETIRKIKINNENKESILLAKIISQRDIILMQLEQKKQELNKIYKERENLKKGGEHIIIQEYIDSIYTIIKRLQNDLINLEFEIENQKKKLLTAVVERKKLDEYKKRWIENEKIKEMKKENKEIDDIVSNRLIHSFKSNKGFR
jgi:flagellar export protein FliJ